MNFELSRRSFLGGGAALLASATARSYADAVGAGKPNLKVGLLSDIHIASERTTRKYVQGDPNRFRPRETKLFEQALAYFDSRGADAVVLAGDLADWGLVSQMKELTDSWWKMFPNGRSKIDGRKVELLAVLGNHDVAFRAWTKGINYAVEAMGKAKAAMPPEEVFMNDIPGNWERLFREPYTPIWKKTIKGYTFIGAHWDSERGVPAIEPYMAEHGPALKGEKPFFYIQHAHPRNTCFGPNVSGRDAGYSTRALEPFPNAVAISGHAHRSLTDERNVWQGAFTSIGTASLDSVQLGGARENTKAKARNRRRSMANVQVIGRVFEKEITFAAHGVFMSVYDGFIELERREFVHGKSAGSNWVVPVPAGKNPPFSFEVREKAGLKPGPFPEGAAVRVVRKKESVHLEFPLARNVEGSSRALDYEIEAIAEEADVKRTLFRRFVASPGAMLAPSDEKGPGMVDFINDLFPKGVDVRFAVRARDVFGGFNEPIFGSLGRVMSAGVSNRHTRRCWKAFDAVTVDSIDGFKPKVDTGIDEYGGSGVKAAEATGFFRTLKKDGRWWLTDPLGHLYISKGVAVFTPGGSSRQKKCLMDRFGSTAKWATDELRFLKGVGFNSLGAWSRFGPIVKEDIPEKMPYTVIVNVMSNYLKHHHKRMDVPVALDEKFDAFLDSKISDIKRYVNDPYLIGYFVDNELPWKEKALSGCYEAYLAKVKAALSKYDPNHLYLGCRFNKWDHELGREDMLRIAGKYMDVISVNHYAHWQPDVATLRKWEKWSGKPIMITEFYAKGEDSGLPNATGGGWLVRTQGDRGIFYENFVNELIKSKVCVGWHWFKYMDNDPTDLKTDPSNRDSNKGVVAWDFKRYDPLLAHMKRMNSHVYGLSGFYEKYYD